jgi:nucleotide-binding universal stress UspA family protein
VAIDPESQDPADEALAKRLLTLSRSLADQCSGELTILSCWDYEFESYLRGNLWVDVPDEQIASTVLSTQRQHREALDQLIQSTGIAGDVIVKHLRGHPSEMIPSFLEKNEIDILVMGTLARTGIPGVMIGNTAEDIVQQLSCSLMAMKPGGFVSPVKPR